MTSQVLTNPKGDKEMLFSPDLPDEHFNRYSQLPLSVSSCKTYHGPLCLLPVELFSGQQPWAASRSRGSRHDAARCKFSFLSASCH